MSNKGHEFLIIARRKEVSHALLEKYHIPFISRGKGSGNILGKVVYMFKADWILFKNAITFKPDLFISFASPYAAHIAKFIGKPHISLTDTDNATFGILSFAPFTENILTPQAFRRNFGKKHIRFDSYMEMSYLHPNFYNPDYNSVLKLGFKENEKYVLIRFVTWNANHDIGQTGLTHKEKIVVTQELSKYVKVMISSEGKIPDQIEHLRIKIPPERMHDVLSYATLYIGEGATMASECAMLGTPAIYINSLSAGTLEEQEKFGLIFNFRTSKGIIEKAIELLLTPNLKEEFKLKRNLMLSQTIDLTAFMIWFVENYPQSFQIIKENPAYQDRFK